MLLDNEIFIEYVGEVENYLPVIRNGIEELQSHPDNQSVLQEVFRLVHIIRGASAMLGVTGLSQLAGCMESSLDHVIKGEASFDTATFSAMTETTDLFADYCTAMRRGNFAEDAELTTRTQTACEMIKGVSQTAQKSIISSPVSLGETADNSSLGADVDLDEELMAEFNAEANEHFEEIGRNMLQLFEMIEGSAVVEGELKESLRSIRRSVHTIKGASAVIGLQNIADLGHKIEDGLDWFYEFATTIEVELLEVLGHLFDQFEQLVNAPASYDAQVAEKNLAELQKIIENAPKRRDEDDIPSSEAEEPSTGSMSASLFSPEEQELLRTGFMEEAEEHLQEIDSSLQFLESQVEQNSAFNEENREAIRTIRRGVHTIKGASAVIGLDSISGYAHRVEDFLDWLFEKATQIGPETVALLTESLDILSAVVENPVAVADEKRQGIFDRLDNFTRGKGQEVADEVLPIVEQEEAVSIVSESKEKEADDDLWFMFDEPSTSLPDFVEQEQKRMQQGFDEDTELHLEHLQKSVQLLERSITEKTRLEGSVREQVTNMHSSSQFIHAGAIALGMDSLADYSQKLADFLKWLLAESTSLTPVLINTVADAVHVLELLVESPEETTAQRIAEASAELAKIQQPSASGDWQDNNTNARDAAGTQASGPGPEAELTQQRNEIVVAPQASAIDKPVSPPAAAEVARTIRINQTQLDTFINLANELLVGVSGFDRNMDWFRGALEELDLTIRRLKDIALELETQFEVKALDQLSEHFARLDQAKEALHASAGFEEFDAMELDRYTQLNLIIRSLNESTIDVAAIHGTLEGVYSGIGGDINRQHRVVRELQVQIMRARLSPMSVLTPRLSRTMRDVASKLKKRVRLIMEGDAVELDRTIWEKLADPFMHLVRNSVHHGIESPEERAAVNKTPLATIRISGQREGNNVVVRFSDDGQGLDYEAIKTRAKQIMDPAEVDTMSEEELVSLIFISGFSTKSISEISGRGVGMDVVRQNVQDLQGSIFVNSVQGKGIQFTIRVPLTMGVVRSLLVDVEGTSYGIPISDIRDIQRIAKEDILTEEHSFSYKGAVVPIFSLAELIGKKVSEEEKESLQPLVCLSENDGRPVGVSIGRIAGQKEVVLKGLGSHLRTVAGVSGAAVMGDGSIVPLLNISELINSYRRVAVPVTPKVVEKAKTLKVMVVDDSISIRKVMSRLIASHGWIPVEAKDGQDALEQLDIEQPDCILLDIEMPRMNGFEFLGIKANREHKDIPVIMLTSRTSDKHRQKAMELGASVFLNKPTKDEDFVDAVLSLTGHKRKQKELRHEERRS